MDQPTVEVVSKQSNYPLHQTIVTQSKQWHLPKRHVLWSHPCSHICNWKWLADVELHYTREHVMPDVGLRVLPDYILIHRWLTVVLTVTVTVIS